tara:strand:- start:439 stop:627 length:189 start_codon:yes stop_codon:yes gene_type:complete
MNNKRTCSYFTYIDAEGEEQPCDIYTKVKRKLVLTADKKLTLLLTLWVLDKVVMTILLLLLR